LHAEAASGAGGVAAAESAATEVSLASLALASTLLSDTTLAASLSIPVCCDAMMFSVAGA
jgi:hypothetical protein